MSEHGYDLTNPYEAASRRRRPVTGIHVEKAEFDRVCAERDAMRALLRRIDKEAQHLPFRAEVRRVLDEPVEQ